MNYQVLEEKYFKYAQRAASMYGVPYFPNVTMGWDPTPRMPAGQRHDNRGYPNMGVVVNNTPARFEAALAQAKALAAATLPPEQRIVTINAWNEWTEGSYLEPDKENAMAYLEAVGRVFGARG
jgi:hypothetical protein